MGAGATPQGGDEAGIRRTLARYGQLLDDGRFDEWVEVFADDVEFRVMGQALTGPDAVRAFIEPTQQAEARGTHLMSEPLIELGPEGGEAGATTDFAFVSRKNRIEATGRYLDRLRHEEGTWRICAREIVLQ